MAYNVVVVLLSWQLILPHLTVVQASTHWVVTEDGRIQAQVGISEGLQNWSNEKMHFGTHDWQLLMVSARSRSAILR